MAEPKHSLFRSFLESFVGDRLVGRSSAHYYNSDRYDYYKTNRIKKAQNQAKQPTRPQSHKSLILNAHRHEIRPIPGIKGHGLSLIHSPRSPWPTLRLFASLTGFDWRSCPQSRSYRRSAKSPAYPALLFLSGHPLISTVYD